MKYIRQRYILFEIITQDDVLLEKEQVLKPIWKNLIKLFGEFTTFHVGLWMIRWDSNFKIGIIRCDNISKYELIATLALIRKINSVNVIIHTRKTSGTIKKTLKLWREYFNTEPPKREDKNKPKIK
ncbi:MAG: Rpp14/Pop5 family protein, partial [Candidatus Heimdallarchaeota archaeon]|nr:Rpp14/Pop5 family protein [Candidatus Heimdallarchaeota archaeon]